MILGRRDCREKKCMTKLHGGIYRQTSIQYNSYIQEEEEDLLS